MKNPRFWIAVLVASVVVVLLDFFVQGQLLAGSFYSTMESTRKDVGPGWFIFGDVVAVLVLAWIFARVGPVFGVGVKGGIAAGFMLGVLVCFPTYHFLHLMFRDYSYALTWISTGYGIVWYMIAGAILGAIARPAGTTGAS